MRIDHLVYYDADLAQARGQFAEHMDAAPSYGGEHSGEGTANALLSLGPSTYLEILGRDPAQPETTLDPEVAKLKGTGLYHFAVGGIDLNEAQRRASRAGLSGGPLVPGGRMLPSGKRLGWTCFGIRGHGFGSLVPFFIDWMESEHPAVSAPRGGSLAAFEALTTDPAGLKAIYEALGLDIAVRHGDAPAIAATLQSSKGALELRSFSPLPRGYVI